MLLPSGLIHVWFHRIFADIAKLAPLSIVVAALTFINTIRQARAKQKEDKAQAIRQTLIKAGTAAYVLNWSLLGDPEFAAGVLQIRDLIEDRLGKQPPVAEIQKLFNDKVLVEGIIEKAWRDSGAVSKYRTDALEFSRFQAEIGNRIPIVQDAFEQISSQLRMLLISDIFIIQSVRNDEAYQKIEEMVQGKITDPLSQIQRKLLSELKRKDGNTFSEACRLVEAIANVAAVAPNRKILALLDQPFWLVSIQERWRATKLRKTSRTLQADVSEKLRLNFPAENDLLVPVATKILSEHESIVEMEHRFQTSLESLTRHFGGLPGSTKLEDACKAFLTVQLEARKRKNTIMLSFVRLKCLAIEDPDIDIFLGVSAESTKLLENALSRGANPNVRDKEVLARHKETLSRSDDTWFINATGLNAENSPTN
jgi:hypothetical protein